MYITLQLAIVEVLATDSSNPPKLFIKFSSELFIPSFRELSHMWKIVDFGFDMVEYDTSTYVFSPTELGGSNGVITICINECSCGDMA